MTTERGKRSRLVNFKFESPQTDEHLTIDDMDNILKAISFVRREIGINRDSINIVVHDKQSGVSGAAVFVALLLALEDMDDKTSQPDAVTDGPLKTSKEINTLEVFNIIDALHKKRMKMVRNQDDYALIFKALQHYAQNWKIFQSILEMKTDPSDSKKKYPFLPIVPQKDKYVLEDGSPDGSYDENILGLPYGSMESEQCDFSKSSSTTTNDPTYHNL